MRGSVLPKILPRICAVTLFAVGLVWIDQNYMPLPHTSAAPFAVFGIALSLFLGFRNNAAHDRCWEGRKLWGQLIANMRALAREVEIFIPERAGRHRILTLALGFIHAHRLNLRQLPAKSAPLHWLSAEDMATPHPPCTKLNQMTEVIVAVAQWRGGSSRSCDPKAGASGLRPRRCPNSIRC